MLSSAIQLHRLTFATRYSSEPRVDLDEVEQLQELEKKQVMELEGIDNPGAVFSAEKEASGMKPTQSVRSELDVEEIPRGAYDQLDWS